MHTVKLLTTLIEQHQVLVYVLICLGLIFEGEIILLSTGIFLHLGALNPFVVFCVVFWGLLAKTFLGYYIGGLIHEKWHKTKFLKYIEKKILYIMPHFNKKPFWSIFISKFIVGVNNMVIVFSGFEKVNYKKYLKAEISSTLIWAPLMVSLGYFFSYTALHISKEVSKFSLVILIFVIGYIIFDKIVEWIYEFFEEFYGDRK